MLRFIKRFFTRNCSNCTLILDNFLHGPKMQNTCLSLPYQVRYKTIYAGPDLDLVTSLRFYTCNFQLFKCVMSSMSLCISKLIDKFDCCSQTNEHCRLYPKLWGPWTYTWIWPCLYGMNVLILLLKIRI